MSEKTYLGDGVYIERLDGRLKLTTDNGKTVTNTIWLEWDTCANLLHYLSTLPGPTTTPAPAPKD